MPNRFAAIIAHADDPDLLERCIAHHLAIGFERIFVSLNGDDPSSDAVANSFVSDGRVRAMRVAAFAVDPFRYFTAALDVVRAWADPDWVAFIDSDEFWLPASGRIADTAGIEPYNIVAVPRFNIPPVREDGGAVRTLDAIDPATALLVNAERIGDAQSFADEPATIWVMTKDHAKVLVRAEVVGEVGRGAHTIEPRTTLHGTTAHDLLIAHLPFTSRERFHRKIAAIRARLGTFGDRFEAGQAWHWRRWMALDAAGEIDTEFDRQLVDARDLAALQHRNVLATPAAIFARESIVCR